MKNKLIKSSFSINTNNLKNEIIGFGMETLGKIVYQNVSFAGFGVSESYTTPLDPNHFFHKVDFLDKKSIKSFDFPGGSISEDGNLFIGLDGNAHFEYGGRYKIGWDVK